jgi:hypothetical protein
MRTKTIGVSHLFVLSLCLQVPILLAGAFEAAPVAEAKPVPDGRLDFGAGLQDESSHCMSWLLHCIPFVMFNPLAIGEWGGAEPAVDVWSTQNGSPQPFQPEIVDPWRSTVLARNSNEPSATNSYPTLTAQLRNSSATRSSASRSSSTQRSSIRSPPNPQPNDPNSAEKRSSQTPPPVPSTGSVSKEEKAAEMARRKEERKQVRRAVDKYGLAKVVFHSVLPC